MINGSKAETDKYIKGEGWDSISIVFNEGSSHAFVLEQLLQKLSKKFAPRKELIEQWKLLLNNN